MKGKHLPNLKDINEASARISGVASVTPLVESPALSRRFGRRIYLKLECFQPTGAFKIRGAHNKISQLRENSIIAASSGNHGIAVAYSSYLLGKRCRIVVPENVVEEKARRISDYGAEVVRFGRYGDERAAKAIELAKQTRAAFVHPYDDPDVIAGQGTCGLEIAAQLPKIDSVLIPVGGGGLISGSAIGLKAKHPSAKIFGVEPEGAPKLRESLKAGRPVSLSSPKSIADGLIPTSLSELTFEACRKYLDGAFTVSDDQIISAMKLMLKEAHVIAEPSGAAPLALLLAGQDLPQLGRRVVLVVSGGNISLSLLSRLVSDSS